ncbi:MAG: ABC transporter ATP-binding protein [Burkholderiales bacterium]|nr:ABC transporter ATP-binding protein [Burkholderiales bacterium]OJX08874.1 MAG: ABC transporter ATP-binding protein [Burkholderiales bacterium 70-64]
MAETARLELRGVCKSFGALRVTDDVSLTVGAGELHALIGPNGAGKTTLIAQISGELQPDAGDILVDGQPVTRMPAHRRAAAGLARSFQISQVFPEFDVEDNVAMAVQAHSPGGLNMWRDARRDPRLRAPAREAIARVGLGERGGVRVSELAHGEKRQLELAMALALDTSILLLDEPMAGMSAEESRRMAGLLADLKRHYAILLVEHDMDIVFALADRITVLVYGRVIFTGTPDAVRASPEVRSAYLGGH